MGLNQQTSLKNWFQNLFYKPKKTTEIANENFDEIQDQELTEKLNFKSALEIIDEVNETLMSDSIKSVLTNATDTLSSCKEYTKVFSGLVSGDKLEIISQSSTTKETEEENTLSQTILKALQVKHPVFQNIDQENTSEWIGALPLVENFQDEAYGFLSITLLRENGFEPQEMKMLENMSYNISLALYPYRQKKSIFSIKEKKELNYAESILNFVDIIEQEDSYTIGHSLRVAKYCGLIAKEMGIAEEDVIKLEKAAILHDIGKITTHSTIVCKMGKISHLEYELVKQHSEIGADILEDVASYKRLAQIIKYHHARYDGKGYPKTDSPNEIPMLSHILIIADAFDAMTTNKVYRAQKSKEEALLEIESEKGTQFHPEVVDILTQAFKDINLNNKELTSSELEKKRMSYFFHDALTGVYNEDYLYSILDSTDKKYECMHIIDVKNFSQYKKEYGSKKANEFLKDFADYLKESYPDAIIIKDNSNDFVILQSSHREIYLQELIEFQTIKNALIKISIEHHHLDKNLNYDDLKKLKS